VKAKRRTQAPAIAKKRGARKQVQTIRMAPVVKRGADDGSANVVVEIGDARIRVRRGFDGQLLLALVAALGVREIPRLAARTLSRARPRVLDVDSESPRAKRAGSRDRQRHPPPPCRRSPVAGLGPAVCWELKRPNDPSGPISLGRRPSTRTGVTQRILSARDSNATSFGSVSLSHPGIERATVGGDRRTLLRQLCVPAP
jgi:hypothetical protein